MNNIVRCQEDPPVVFTGYIGRFLPTCTTVPAYIISIHVLLNRGRKRRVSLGRYCRLHTMYA